MRYRSSVRRPSVHAVRQFGEVHEPKLTQRLSSYPNVTFIAPRQPDQLPAVLARTNSWERRAEEFEAVIQQIG